MALPLPATADFPMTPTCPVVARDQSALRAALAAPAGTRAVVMTMGALHDGHLALLRAARARCDQLVATIYVNPLQFGPHEDLARYPRTLAADLELCARAGVDVVFAPEVVHDPLPLVTVSSGPIGNVLEGASRPGHFDGVLTIVATMLHLVRPDLAFFGQKDAQQLVAIRKMVADLAFDTEIVAVPTVRDADGLARSSRNVYLSADQRQAALALPGALAAGAEAAASGGDRDEVLTAGFAVLRAEPGVDLDYLELVDALTLAPATRGDALLLVAARVGSTRLIDNAPLVLSAPDRRPPAAAGARAGVQAEARER